MTARVRARVTSLPASRSQSTALAAATQRSQSPALSPTVPNARCSGPTYTTSSCRTTDSPIALQTQRFVNRRVNALRSSDRAFSTLKSWASISVVNAIVCA